MPSDESWFYCYDPETKRQSSQWKHADSPRPKEARQSKSTHNLLMILFFDSTGMIYMHWLPTGQTVNKEYYVEFLREFRKRFRRKRPPLFKCTSPQLHPITDYLTKMGNNTVPQPPYSPDLASCDFCLFPKLKGCRYETIEKMKEAVTKIIDTPKGLSWGFPEVVGTVEKVHCGRRRLLRMELEFHVCTINKSAYMKKVWKLI